MRAWLDRLIPAPLHADPDALRRARLTVVLSAVLMAAGVTYSLLYGVVVRFAAGGILPAAGAVVALVTLLALRRRPYFRVAGHAFAGVLYVVVLGLVWHSGGLPSPISPWFIMPAVLAALVLGWQAATFWTVTSVATIGALFVAGESGVRFAMGYEPAWTLAVTFACHTGLVVCIAIMIWLFEDNRLEAQARAEAATAALARLAYHDALTGLVNRARFLECVGTALTRAHAEDEPARVVVMLMDLDGFKTVNDTLGHAGGDALLAAVAARLLNATRGSDTVARLGGDEFAVLLDGVREDAAVAIVADRIVAAIAAPFVLDGQPAAVSSSLGVARGRSLADAALAPRDAAGEPAGAAPAPRLDVAALLRDADVAMYRAKALGKGRWVRFEPEMLDDGAERPPSAWAATPAFGGVAHRELGLA